MFQESKVESTGISNKTDKRIPLTNYDKIKLENDNQESPPSKKARIADSLEESIDAKLSEIRCDLPNKNHPNTSSQMNNVGNKNSKKKNKKKNKQQSAINMDNASKESSSQPTEFNYGNVDFKQFGGGSQKVASNEKLKKNKGRKGKDSKV